MKELTIIHIIFAIIVLALFVRSAHAQSADSVNVLHEIVVTAREGDGLNTGSRIDRDAMAHLQPTSFTDLLELLPGGVSQNPAMGKTNTINLRETGSVSATGVRTDTPDDYAISSLGTVFMVDGAPVSGDADLQAVPGSASDSPESRRAVMNRGVDMRTISTDNIESVEIVRGIPSAEYGNLTSGVVNIRRIRRATPLMARFKADEYSKLFSVGKGLSIGRQVINADLSWLDSRVDPRDSRENYKRLTGSLRASLTWGDEADAALRHTLNIGGDYTGSFDNAKVDPDLNYNKIDEYESRYNRWALTADYTLNLRRHGWLNLLAVNASASYERDRLTRRKQVSPQRASVAPTTMQPGVHDGRYLLGEYIADYVSDGRPLCMFLKIKAGGSVYCGDWSNTWKAGADWSLAKNYGHGQVYDLSRPLSASWTTRPRAFRDIPAQHVVAGYVEDNVRAQFGTSVIELQAGLRAIAIAGLDKRYRLSGRLHLDPRLNLLYRMPGIDLGPGVIRLTLAGGYGLTSRMPTVDYLYPQPHYNDMIQLNYYDVNQPSANSRVSLRTYIDDATNYRLRAACNRKWECRVGAEWMGNHVTVTYFNERLNSGFRYSTVYAAYALRRYDSSVIVPGSLSAPPDPDQLPYVDLNILDGYRQVTNGSRIDKEGIEYQLTTARLAPLKTSLTVSGAWFRTRYSNSQHLYQTVNDVVGNRPVSEQYVGLYDTEDGRINSQLNTNFMFDTQISRWGLVFTTSIQCVWFLKTRRLRDNGIPMSYLSVADGRLHNYTEADQTDLTLQYLVKHYNDAAYNTQTVPPAIYLNLKASKQIGRWLRVSAFVNRILDYLPDYKSNGMTIRRSSDVYFGMEANLSF